MQQNITFSFDMELDTNFNWKKYVDEKCIEITLESGQEEGIIYQGRKVRYDREDSFSMNSNEFRLLESVDDAQLGPHVPHDSTST